MLKKRIRGEGLMKKLLLFIMAVAAIFVVSCGKKPVLIFEEEEPLKVKVVDVSISGSDSDYSVDITSNGDIKYEVFTKKKPFKIVVFANEALFDTKVLNFQHSDDLFSKVAMIPGDKFSKIELFLNKDVEYETVKNANVFSIKVKVINPTVKALGEEKTYDKVDTVDEGLASRVMGLENLSEMDRIKLKLKLNGIVRFDYGYLNDNTMYLDLFDVRSGLPQTKYAGKGLIKDLSVNQYYPPQKVRLLINVISKKPIFAGQNGSELILSSEMDDVPESRKYISSIDTVSYKKVQSVIIKFIGRVSYTKKIVNDSLYLEFEDDVKPLGNVRSVYTFRNKPLERVELIKVDGKTVLICKPSGDVYARVDETPEGILISSSFEDFSKANLEFAGRKDMDSKNAGMADKADDSAERITLNMVDMDLRQVIRLILYGRNDNIVFDKDVKGLYTLYLKDVHYKTALNIVLKGNDLVMREVDGVAMITTKAKYEKAMDDIAKKKRDAQQAKKLAPLTTAIIPVNFSTASDLQGILKSVLTNRGKVEIDQRTNSFVVKDTASAIAEARNLLKTVDKRTPQVTIEARIVEVTDTNQLDLGIQWGFNWNQTHPNLGFPQTMQITGGTAANGLSGSNYLVNLPVSSPTGALALTLGSKSGMFNLDLALSALEIKNKAKTISSPRITTLDNMEAEIKSGSSAVIVPSGDNNEAQTVDVGIKLKVKPHITANNMVFLDIEVEKSSLGTVSANTATTTEKRAKTKVLLANGETTVIGGLYEDERTYITNAVPGLSKIPILGWLFKSQQNLVTKRELLVFLTPYVEQ